MLIDNFAKLNHSSRNVISAALVITVAVAAYGQIVAPHTTYLFAAQRYESVIGNVAEKNKAISDTVEDKKKQLQELREQLVQLQSELFTSDEVKEFFSDLQPICEQTGCTLYALNFITSESDRQDQQSEDASGIVAKSAVLSVIGEYENITKLVKRLQIRTQKVWISSVVMETISGDSPQIRCGITITVYTIQDKGAVLYE